MFACLSLDWVRAKGRVLGHKGTEILENVFFKDTSSEFADFSTLSSSYRISLSKVNAEQYNRNVLLLLQDCLEVLESFN